MDSPNTRSRYGGDYESIKNGFSAFKVVWMWVSDQASHFMHQVIGKLIQELRVIHRLTTEYTTGGNGVVELVCRQFLQATRALLSEFKMQTNQWPRLIKMVQAIINLSPSHHSDGVVPISCLTGIKAATPRF